MKKVIGVYRNDQKHWVGDGFHVSTLFSYDKLGQTLSPFLLLDYAAEQYVEPSVTQKGVGQHPHRGFETVTIAYQGEVTHKDSKGGGGTIKAGDVQWMTAGSGILHEEFHSKDFTEKGGNFEMIQLWVNLPAKEKMTLGHYQAITSENIPVVSLDEYGSFLRVIAGQYNDRKGSAKTLSPLNVWDVELAYESPSYRFTVPKGHTTLVVVRQGALKINDSHIVKDHTVIIFDKDTETDFELKSSDEQKASFVILTGEPLNEPIQGYGPFVMNTKAEIIQAFQDFKSGKF
ncbi:pirin family protein [Acinetobacter nectaris]|uniref:pirin family protein n=1 Tax=Acinetobacter nectaris TaxID=1219382 RepID=UPI001F29EAF1|nr:pirin family protein [Acinetobacter nectaris]MCF8999590.1 pirin family protein [Acinetobacter nectaris]MCF9027172.1 pirin family protein [Acinetobacter nectaris]